MKVKICGITNLDDALLCCSLGADAIGFIFYDKSKRAISHQDAKNIIAKLPPFITKVGVFVNQTPEEINTLSEEIGLNVIQYHADILPIEAKKIIYPVIKVFRVSTGFNFKLLSGYNNCTFLLDTYTEENIGGTGKTFDWNIIPQELRSKIILAGGISIDNIEHIYNIVKPYAIDLSSSVEYLPGKKDKNKLTEFFNKINQLRYSSC
jgi:phosphoribosylanthranilate isomerase